MKTDFIIYLLAIILLGCVEDSNHFMEEVATTEGNKRFTSSALNTLSYAKTQFVVKFVSGLSDQEKNNIRAIHEVADFETCSCTNIDVELWHFANAGDPKGRLNELEADPDLEGVEHQYLLQKEKNLFNGLQGDIEILQSKVKDHNRGVTIAIIDTGVDYEYQGFNTPFLYNSADETNCNDHGSQPPISGWDFANNDHDVYDDNGHGTAITYLIYKRLKNAGVDFQILPVKAFDYNGKSNYFKILCAYLFAAENEDVDIINTSFGWYFHELKILSSYMSVYDDQLISASAGNHAVNTDVFQHFPSGYDLNHIIVTTGINHYSNELAAEANYGVATVDVAAKNHFGLPHNGISYGFSGTSYAAAYVTAQAATLHTIGMSPIILKSNTIFSGTSSPYLIGVTKHPYVVH